MSEFDNGLTKAERERLDLLMEEMGECLQIIGKIGRHGYESYNPFDEKKKSNRDLFTKELADVQVSINRILDVEDVSNLLFGALMSKKEHDVIPYLHHQEEEQSDE